LPVSRARARELTIATAWRAAAGPALARRAEVVGLRRGVLEVSVSDERWRHALEPLLPEIAGRIAGRHRDLGIRACRIVPGDAPPRAIVETADSEPVRRPRPPAGEAPSARAPEPLELRLRRLRAVGERYLARAAGPGVPKP